MIKIYNNDCLNVFKSIENESVDLIVTDPPYKLITGGMKSGFSCGKNNIFKKSKTGLLFKNNNIEISQWIKILFCKVKENSHVYIFVNSLNIRNFLNNIHESGFKLKNILIWQKNNKNASRSYMKNCEYILFLEKGRHKTINMPSSPTCFQFNNPRNKKHPTEKPLDLLEFLIKNSSKENDVIFDPFMGSGSTGVACINSKRKFIGIEIDKEYFDIAKIRLGINE